MQRTPTKRTKSAQPTKRTKRTTKLATAAAALTLALITGACGGGGSDDSAARKDNVASIDGKGAGDDKNGNKDAKGKKTWEEAALDFSRCMRKNGVDMPDPGAGGMMVMGPENNGVSREAMEKAEAACKAEREAMQGSMGKPPADFQDKILKMARCMRSKGIDMPDPHMTDDGKASVEIKPGAMEDPKFLKAQEECRKETGMPEPGAANPSAPGGGS